MKNSPEKTIVIVGPTASGKSDLAISLARKYDGEIISADSRQVYRGMDIGTGKVVRDKIANHPELVEVVRPLYKNVFLSEGIRHHLLDVASPKRNYNITHFVRDAKKAIADIEKRGKVPIICGGTAFWIEALLFGTQFPEVKPNPALRKKLEKLSVEELFMMLEEKDPERAGTIDAKNKVRLIRALEIIETIGKVPAPAESYKLKAISCSIIALNPPKEILHQRIEKRLEKRLREGMIEEVARLHEEGVSWKRLEGFGLEYRWCARFLQGKISRKDLEVQLPSDIRQYAKRQLTFLRRLEKMGAKIHWISDPKDAKAISSIFS